MPSDARGDDLQCDFVVDQAFSIVLGLQLIVSDKIDLSLNKISIFQGCAALGVLLRIVQASAIVGINFHAFIGVLVIDCPALPNVLNAIGVQ